MGTTAQKLEYLNTTKQQLKSALNTDSNVFRDYVALTQKYVNNNPTSTVTNGTCTNALDVPAKNYKVFGNSTQNTTTGKNLINISSNYSLTGVSAVQQISLPAGSYKLTIGDYTSTGGEGSTSKIYLYSDENGSSFLTSSAFSDITTSSLFTLSSEAKSYRIYSKMDYAQSQGVSITVKNLMIRLQSITDETYEPYTGGISSPNPSYPQEITSVGDLVTSGEYTGKYKIPRVQSGKNKLNLYNYNSNFSTTTFTAFSDIFQLKSVYSAPKKIVCNGNSFILEVVTPYDSFTHYKLNNLKPNTEYTISATMNVIEWVDVDGIYFIGNTSSKSSFTDNKYKFTKTVTTDANGEYESSGTTQAFLYVGGSKNGFKFEINDFQIEEGSSATTYESYHTPVTTDIYLDKPLLGISTAKDYIEFATGKRHNLCKNIVLDGNENWFVAQDYGFGTNYTEQSGYIAFAVSSNDWDNLMTSVESGNIIGFSNYNKSFSWSSLQSSAKLGFCIINYKAQGLTANTKIWFAIHRDIASTVSEFKTWLTTHNIKIVNKNVTPTEENITLPQINFWEGTNIITIGTGVQATQEIVYITKGGN